LRREDGQIVGFSRFASKLNTKRIWGMIKEWLELHLVNTHEWTTNLSVKAWWSKIASKGSPQGKAMASLTMFVSWTVWKERNARVFNNKAPPTILLDIIKSETRLWLATGVKHLSYVIPGE
jgi:hypothetical protein